ncbi:MAG: hypothetical protein JEY96_14595 [Bacteroidales bacterium]|nr:hypothetical protein [Bacteroidales bacterium]
MRKLRIIVVSTMVLLQACVSTKNFQESITQNETLKDSVVSINKNYDTNLKEFEEELIKQKELLAYSNAKELELLNTIEQQKQHEENLTEAIVQYKNTSANIEEKLLLMERSQANNVIIKTKTDTVHEVYYPESRQGNVTIFCPREMIFEEATDIYGIISEAISQEIIRSKIREKIEHHEGDASVDLIEGENLIFNDITFFKDVEVDIIREASQGFEIVQLHDSTKQTYSEKMEGWHWKVKPISDGPELILVFRIRIYDNNGIPSYKDDKTFKVKIKVRPKEFFHNTKMLIVNNPKWAFGTLILPFLGFMWGRYQERRKKKTKNNLT